MLDIDSGKIPRNLCRSWRDVDYRPKGNALLLSFRVRNWRSIRDELSIDLYRARNSARDERWKRKDVSPVAAIYGANAAGKSALVKALQFVPTAVRDSFRDWQGDSAIPRTAFVLSAEAATTPSRFEIEFIADDGFEYQYGFEVTDKEVIEEFLYQFKTHRRTRLFHRTGTEYEFGSSLLGPKAQLTAITRKNSLFLSAASSADALSSMASAHRWITSSLHVFGPDGHEAIRSRLPSLLERDRSHTERLMTFIKASDLGIEDISVTTKKLPKETEKTLRQAFANSDVNVDEFIASQEKSLSFSHSGQSGTTVLPLSEQSSGSQALLSIGIVVIAALETGSTCVFDEIDSSLHPHLVSELVEVFKDPRLNRKQGQLIFTSHDVSLLRGGATRSLDRDEVWFVEKSPEGASSITALNEYKARADENWERNYLAGKYGATPVLAIREGLRKLLDSEEQLFEWNEQ